MEKYLFWKCSEFNKLGMFILHIIFFINEQIDISFSLFPDWNMSLDWHIAGF